MEDKIDELLDIVFEVEGLLCLLKKRKENATDQIYDLLIKKASLFNQGLNGLGVLAGAKKDTLTEESLDTVSIPSDITACGEVFGVSLNESSDDSVCTKDNGIGINVPQPVAIEKKVTLNDMFRFRRELFNNDEHEMEEFISILSELPTQAEVEDYLSNDLCMDLDNPTVRDFINALTVHK